MATIHAQVYYVSGHLRYGHYELELDGKELEDFKSYSLEEQKECIKEEGHFVLDDYRINDMGDLSDIEIHEEIEMPGGF